LRIVDFGLRIQVKPKATPPDRDNAMFDLIGNPKSEIRNGMSRRDWLRLCAAGALAVPTSGWLSTLAARAAEGSAGKPRYKSCILLFMTGGASHIDTFDPKPDNSTSEFKPISTTVPSIQVSENLPKMAAQMKECALLRGMSTTEGSHGRARYYMHTGYRQGVGGVTHPSLGSIASAKLGRPDADLPNFVCLGGSAFGAGYAGPQHAPVEIADPARGIDNLRSLGGLSAFDKKASLLEEIERGFLDRLPTAAAEAHQKTYQRAIALMHSEQAKAFDLDQEPSNARDLYGRTRMGNACLLARRLVEHGIAFVEIPMNGWDTHRDNTGRVKTLSGELDQPMAALIADLKQRGMLDSTLVVWMGDFGRTPKVGKQGGRDHYPKAWTTLLAGGGIRGGQALGKTDNLGGQVVERPTSAIDFMATVCKALEIDYTK
jgi:uncharacterized protein (DUF1501 family)